MSTTFRQQVGLEGLAFTQFFGGQDRGNCLQVTPLNERNGTGFVQLTVEQAVELRAVLRDWLNGRLQPED